MIHLAGDRGTLDEKIPIWVMNVNENSGKSLKENFGHENHLILGEDLFFLPSPYFGYENRLGFRTQNSG